MRWFILHTTLFFLFGALPLSSLLCQPLKNSDETGNKIDSLTTLLDKSPANSEKVSIYEQLSWEYINSAQLDLARNYADSIAVLSRKMKDKNGIENAKFYLGVIARHNGEFPEAAEHLTQFVQYFEKIGDSSRVARGMFHLGVVNVYLGNLEKSLASFYRIIKIYEKNQDYLSMGKTFNSIGVLYRKMKRYEDAVKSFESAIAISDSLKAWDDKASALNNIGNLYHETGENKKALHFFQQALEADKRAGNELGIAYDLAHIGVIFNQFNQHDSALNYQLQSLDIRERFSQKYEMGLILKQIGHTYIFLKDYDSAEKYLLRSLEIAKETSAIEIRRDTYSYLSELYAGRQQYKKALAFKDLFASLQDSIVNIESTRQLHELKTRYETEKKDQQIILLAKEKELQEKETIRQATLKNSFIGGFASVAVLAILFVYILQQRLKNQKVLAAKNEEIKEVNFKRKLSELELKALRAQINPHFLFNCMNSINRMVLNHESENASKYLTKFSKLVRLILENSEETTVSLENELDMLESYIQLEALRFKGKIEYEIIIDETIERESTYIPSMVLQPFVENAIWHGLVHKESTEKGKISIFIKKAGNKLVCTIEDNGVGRELAKTLQEKSVLRSKSLGIKITEERLRLLSKEKLEELINISDLKDALNFATGTKVEINIPVC